MSKLMSFGETLPVVQVSGHRNARQTESGSESGTPRSPSLLTNLPHLIDGMRTPKTNTGRKTFFDVGGIHTKQVLDNNSPNHSGHHSDGENNQNSLRRMLEVTYVHGMELRNSGGKGVDYSGGGGYDNNSVHSDRDRGTADLESIHDLIHDPICSGYLFNYCAAVFCSENIRFVMEIDRFKDYFQSDTQTWSKSWKRVDLDLKLDKLFRNSSCTKELIEEIEQLMDSDALVPAKTWPSPKVSNVVVANMIRHIWDTFLSDKAKTQICMPSQTLVNTLVRMKYAHLYGKEVFYEALNDPIKTIFRDIHPRFRNSEYMHKLRARMQEISTLPPSSQLFIPQLPNVMCDRYTVDELKAGVNFTIDDMLEDRVCYREFFRYLQKCIVSENLRFMRCVRLFKDYISSDRAEDKVYGVEWAWTLYKFFLAPYSAYEISVAHNVRRDIMRQLASPDFATFNVVERPTLALLKVHYNNFKSKPEYEKISAVLLAHKEFGSSESGIDDEKAMRKASTGFGCFGL
jgi:hypothetical protein